MILYYGFVVLVVAVIIIIIIITLLGKNWLIFCIVLLCAGVMLVMCISHIVQVPVTDVISFLINFQGFSIRDI